MMVTPQLGLAACVWRLRFLNATLDHIAYSHCHGRLRLIVGERGAALDAWRVSSGDWGMIVVCPSLEKTVPLIDLLSVSRGWTGMSS